MGVLAIGRITQKEAARRAVSDIAILSCSGPPGGGRACYACARAGPILDGPPLRVSSPARLGVLWPNAKRDGPQPSYSVIASAARGAWQSVPMSLNQQLAPALGRAAPDQQQTPPPAGAAGAAPGLASPRAGERCPGGAERGRASPGQSAQIRPMLFPGFSPFSRRGNFPCPRKPAEKMSLRYSGLRRRPRVNPGRTVPAIGSKQFSFTNGLTNPAFVLTNYLPIQTRREAAETHLSPLVVSLPSRNPPPLKSPQKAKYGENAKSAAQSRTALFQSLSLQSPP